MRNTDWTRKPSPYGKGTCGATHTHVSGHRVIHCGHPTALWPYYIVTPAGETVLAPNGRGFKYLADAKAEAERRANTTPAARCGAKWRTAMSENKRSEVTAGTPSPERLGSACTYAMPGSVESGVCGFWKATCRKCGRPIVRVHGFKRWRHINRTTKENNK